MSGLLGKLGALAPKHAEVANRHDRACASGELTVRDLVPCRNNATLTTVWPQVSIVII